jgi:large subunit ribosomal protein L6
VGKRPIELPKGVTVNINGDTVDVQGPKGKLSGKLPEKVSIKKDGEQLVVESSAPGTNAPRLQGLGRALVANMVTKSKKEAESQAALAALLKLRTMPDVSSSAAGDPSP